MIAIQLDVRGLDSASATIEAVPSETGKAAGRGVEKSLEAVRLLWVRRLSGPATHRTLGVGRGHLMRSIGWEMIDPLAGRVGSNQPYARIHEFGFTGIQMVRAHTRSGRPVRAHSRFMVMPQRPHRAPAFRDAQRPIELIMSGAVDEGLAAAKARGDAVRDAQNVTRSEIHARGGSARRTGRGGQPSILNDLIGLR